MREANALKNIKVALIFQMSTLLLSFIDRKIFLDLLGIDYLGIHGLFTNMISMLALAELGVGSAIIYNLYKPLAEKNERTVVALMRIYRKFYFGIGCAIGILGLLMMGTLPFLVKDITVEMQEIRTVYILFVIGTVFTYWTGYKRSLLYADGQNYRLLVADMSANALGMVLKIGALLVMPSYALYVIVHVGSKVIANLWAMHCVNKSYPYLQKYPKEELPETTKQGVMNNIKDLFVHKISEFVVMSTDNLILSVAVGIQAVGKVANYQLIIAAVMSFVAKGIDAIQASMGNLVVTETKEKVYSIYEELNFICFWIGSLTTVCLVGLTQPFINLWIGEQYQLDNRILGVLIVNYALCVLSRPLWQMMSISGLFKEDKRNAVAEMLVNLVISIILVMQWGTIGVFIGTTCSYIVAWVLKSRLLYKQFFNIEIKTYGMKLMGYISLIVVEVLIVLKSIAVIEIQNDWIAIVLYALICVVIPSIINTIVFWRSLVFKKLLRKGTNMIKEMLEDSNRYDKWITPVMCLLFLLIPLHGSLLPTGDLVGNIASLSFIGISGLYLLWHTFNRKSNPPVIRYALWAYLGLMVCMGISGLWTGGMAGLKVAIWMGFMTCGGVACALIDWRQLGKGILIIDVGVWMWLGHAYYWLINWDTLKLEQLGSRVVPEWDPKFWYIYDNPNFTGMFFALLIMFLMIAYAQKRGERYLLYSLLVMPLLVETGSRTALLAVLSMGLMYILWFVTSRFKVLHVSVLLGIIGISVALMVIYPQLDQWEGFQELSQWIQQVTNKKLLSGREHVWKDAWFHIGEKPLNGYGLQVTLQELTGKEYHAHNQFLHTALQGGVIGVGLLISVLSSIWLLIYKARDSRIARVVGSVLVGIIVMGLFENTLLGDNIRQGIWQWSMLGIGLSAVRQKVYKKRNI